MKIYKVIVFLSSGRKVTIRRFVPFWRIKSVNKELGRFSKWVQDNLNSLDYVKVFGYIFKGSQVDGIKFKF